MSVLQSVMPEAKSGPVPILDFQPVLDWSELDRNGRAKAGRAGCGPIPGSAYFKNGGRFFFLGVCGGCEKDAGGRNGSDE